MSEQSGTFVLAEALELLARTPALLDVWLRGLPAGFLAANEGPGTWNPEEVVIHLDLAERKSWIPRVQWLLEHGESRAFEPFQRVESASSPVSLAEHLESFARLRADNIRQLESLHLDDEALDRVGRHPEFGLVTLRQLLATWVVHDLDHISQIVRVLAGWYADEVGPWRAYLRVVHT
jgi:hypothetical protein